jgi:hypothetical protein
VLSVIHLVVVSVAFVLFVLLFALPFAFTL